MPIYLSRQILSRLSLPWPASARLRSLHSFMPYATLSTPARHSDVPPPSRNVRALVGLLPFLRPYRLRISAAGVFLVMAAATTLVFPIALKSLIDTGLVAA